MHFQQVAYFGILLISVAQIRADREVTTTEGYPDDKGPGIWIPINIPTPSTPAPVGGTTCPSTCCKSYCTTAGDTCSLATGDLQCLTGATPSIVPIENCILDSNPLCTPALCAAPTCVASFCSTVKNPIYCN